MALTSPWFKHSPRLQQAAENSPVLKAGEHGPAVGLLQLALVELGYQMPISMAKGGADAKFGQETANTVRAFQADQQLSQDGIAGRNTLTRLDQLIAGKPLADLGAIKPGDSQRGRKRIFNDTIPGAGPGPKAQQSTLVPTPVFPPPSSPPSSTPVKLPQPVASYTPPKVVSGTSPAWVEIGSSSRYSVGVNGKDRDLSNNDVTPGTADAPWYMESVYDKLKLLPNGALETIWRTAFDKVHNTGPTGSAMIDRFMSGSGMNMTHPDGSDLCVTAAKTRTFKKAAGAAQVEIEKQLKAQFATGSIDFMKLSVTINIPFSTGTKDYSVPLRFRAMIGGIHGTKLYMRNFRVQADPLVTYVPFATYDLQYVLGDHFGVGNDDLYTPDLICMNILQHERSGTKPFINFIECIETNLRANLM